MNKIVQVVQTLLTILFSVLAIVSLFFICSNSFGSNSDSSHKFVLMGIVVFLVSIFLVVLFHSPSKIRRRIAAIVVCWNEFRYRKFHKYSDLIDVIDPVFESVGMSGLYEWTMLRYVDFEKENKR